jgi:hypothetical protein
LTLLASVLALAPELMWMTLFVLAQVLRFESAYSLLLILALLLGLA